MLLPNTLFQLNKKYYNFISNFYNFLNSYGLNIHFNKNYKSDLL